MSFSLLAFLLAIVAVSEGRFPNVCGRRIEPICFNYTAIDHVSSTHEDNYQLEERIGRGKFSAVSSGKHLPSGEKVAVKFIINQEVEWWRVHREMKLLDLVSGGDGVVRFYDYIPHWGKSLGFGYDQEGLPAFVTQFIPGDARDYRMTYANLDDRDVRIVFYQLLQALNHSHSMGIVHKDIKPLNIAINQDTLEVRLLDWGSGDFYYPGKKFTAGGGTKGYKPPEMLLGQYEFTYAYDIWCLGIVLASTVFQIFPLWNKPPKDERHLGRMAHVLGRAGLDQLLQQSPFSSLSFAQRKLVRRASAEGLGWWEFVDQDNMRFLSEELIDFLNTMLKWDQKKRPTAAQAMKHRYFAPVRKCLKSTHKHKTPLKLPDGFQVPELSLDRMKFYYNYDDAIPHHLQERWDELLPTLDTSNLSLDR